MAAVHRLLPGDTARRAAWDAFVQGCPEATFFHLSGWQSVLTKVFRHETHFLYTTADDHPDSPIQAVLPLAHVRSALFGSSLGSLPFAVYGGVAAQESCRGDAAASLLDHAAELAHDLGVAHLELRNRQPRQPQWPRQDLYVTFRKTIEPDEQANLLAIPRKQRAMVRKGERHGLRSTVDTRPGGAGLDRFFRLYADNVHRHGTPALPRRHFEVLRAEFGPSVEVLTVEDAQGGAVSSVLSFYFRDEVLPYYAGDSTAARSLAGNDFKYWELMRRACANGVRTFDFGRSKRGTGSFDFKRNWGFAPQALHYEYRLFRRDTVPQHNPQNPRYRWLIQAWRRLPVGLATRLGPHLVRSLG